MLTGQDMHDLAAETPPPVAAEAAQVDAAPAPPSQAALWRLIQARPCIERWHGPYVERTPAIDGAHLRAVILCRDGDLYAYEIDWRAGGSGAVVGRQHGFIHEAEARAAAQWELDRLEKLLAES